MLTQSQVGWKCAVCGERVAIGTPLSWRCPNSNDHDTHHVLQIEQPIAPLRSTGDDNPYIAFRKYLAWDAFAAALGMSDDARVSLIRQADAAVQRVAGTGFRFTPFARHDALSDALGFSAGGGVWVKDETHGVAGSHKSRHLFTEMLHLLAAEETELRRGRRLKLVHLLQLHRVATQHLLLPHWQKQCSGLLKCSFLKTLQQS